MKRSETFLFSALQALMISVIGIGITLIPMTVIWLIENDPSIPWAQTFKASADIWLVAHGVNLEVPAGRMFGIDVPAFHIWFLPLGFSALIAFLIYRAGRRLAIAEQAWPGWLAIVGVYFGVSVAMTTFSADAKVFATEWQGVFFPTLFAAVFVILGTAVGKPLELELGQAAESPERIGIRAWFAERYNRFGWAIRALFKPALRAGTAVVVSLLAVSAIAIGLLVGFNWILITQLYEGLRVTVAGGIMVTAGQIALIPNLVIFGASWLTGVGFAIGDGSLISPLGTAAGPMPALPMLGALPVGQLSIGMIALVIPVAAAFIATLAIRKLADEIRFEFASPLSAAIALGVSIGAVAAVEIGVLVAFASGSFGPGRLAVVGANPFFVAGSLFVETAVVATLAAFYSARPDAPDHELVQKLKR